MIYLKLVGATIYYIDGTNRYLSGEAAQQIKSALKNHQISPNGIWDFDDATIFVSHIKEIEWYYES